MKLEQSQETLLLNICELNARIEAHEVQCEERTKTIFNRLEAIEENISNLNSLLTKREIIASDFVLSSLAINCSASFFLSLTTFVRRTVFPFVIPFFCANLIISSLDFKIQF